MRDDVQISIYDRYPNDIEKRTALAQQAKALQEAVIAGNSLNDNEISLATRSIMDAVDCLQEKFFL